MVAILTCPNCQNRFRPPANHTGAKVACPRCEHMVAVPGETGPDEITHEKPTARKAVRKPQVEVEVEADEDAPARKSRFEPCPRCGAEDPKRVMYTFWGSFYVPPLVNHVRCRKCKYAYNGRTGGSNLLIAIICVTIPLLLIAGIIGVIVYIWMQRQGGL
ncbi:MAG TPA: hypothetical protein VMS17_33620 [Gemmataceae bacterium]|nr:hypothetical protein [Gemmataceae bacterium]